jgi:predicted naringenin-chalcone synthase
LQANPGKRAAVIAVESPTATFQLDDFSMANIVSAAILVTELLVFYYLHMKTMKE